MFGVTYNLLPYVWWFNYRSYASWPRINWIALIINILMVMHYVLFHTLYLIWLCLSIIFCLSIFYLIVLQELLALPFPHSIWLYHNTSNSIIISRCVYVCIKELYFLEPTKPMLKIWGNCFAVIHFQKAIFGRYRELSRVGTFSIKFWLMMYWASG